MSSIPKAIQELQGLRQWTDYFFLYRGSDMTKPPLNPHVDARLPLRERLAQVNDPTTWGTYAEAIARLHVSRVYGYKGIGFMFSATDPYCGIDIDTCRDKKTGQLTAWAIWVIQLLKSYTEISPRETGIHILVRADMEEVAKRLHRTSLQHKDSLHATEIYDRDRYFTITGNHLSGTPTSIENRQDEVTHLYTSMFPREGLERATNLPHMHPLPGDQELLDLAQRARNGSKFTRLWQGNLSDYGNDDSRADQALLGMLAYWTDRDAVRMERLFKQSGLYTGRPDRQQKWNARASKTGETYGERSIRVAIRNCYRTYDPTWKPSRPAHDTRTPEEDLGQPPLNRKLLFPIVMSCARQYEQQGRGV